ncbi:hypothetical protein [Methyloprofundus sp.]|uniref:hypothetical protein n=1 Tax=Methyloprofundus sp. TaxID=2020875 RepID=UPI003D139D6F
MTIEGDGDKTPCSKTGTHTVHGSFYGFVWAQPDVDKCENGRGLYRARYHTNLGYVLAPVFSLGLYVPQTVEWWCDGRTNDEGEEEYQPESL